MLGMIVALFLNLVIIKPLSKMILIPPEIMVPQILILAFLGSFALRYPLFTVLVKLVFGILGYYMDKYGYSFVWMVLAMILGPINEESFFQGWKIGHRSFAMFFC
jgi:putative tricarboxylic transport membrane protein